MLGWTQDEAVGQPHATLFPDQQQAPYLPDGHAHRELWYARRDGTRLRCAAEIVPLQDESGAPAGFAKILRDRTAQHLARARQREAEGLNTLILESSRDCIVVLDLEGHTLFVSPGGIASMEVTDLAAVLGKSWLRVWWDDAQRAATHAVAEARAGRIGRFAGFCPTHAGTPKWWDVVISPLPGADGRPERLVAIGRDITEAKQAEQRLARSEERLNLALGASEMVGVWDCDLVQGHVFGDANFARLHGISPAQAEAGAPIADFFARLHPDDLAPFRAQMYGLLSGGDTFAIEHRLLQPDGGLRWVVARGRLVRDAEGRPARIPGALVDVTERRLAEERQRLLMDELSHRVKNTLAVVQSIARQTLRGEGEIARGREALCARLVALAGAHDMLLHGDGAEASLRTLVDAAGRPYEGVETARFRLSGPDVTLGSRAALGVALVLHELGTNAAKYGALSGEHGQVEVTWTLDHRLEGQHLHLEWRERGGPPVVPPTHSGFGSRLIERSLAAELSATISLAYPPAGATFTLDAPLAALRS